MVGKVVRSLGCGGGYTSSTRQQGVSIMGEFMSTEQIHTQTPDFSMVKLRFYRGMHIIFSHYCSKT